VTAPGGCARCTCGECWSAAAAACACGFVYFCCSVCLCDTIQLACQASVCQVTHSTALSKPCDKTCRVLHLLHCTDRTLPRLHRPFVGHLNHVYIEACSSAWVASACSGNITASVADSSTGYHWLRLALASATSLKHAWLKFGDVHSGPLQLWPWRQA
jgi:hypothetical protein